MESNDQRRPFAAEWIWNGGEIKRDPRKLKCAGAIECDCVCWHALVVLTTEQALVSNLTPLLKKCKPLLVQPVLLLTLWPCFQRWVKRMLRVLGAIKCWPKIIQALHEMQVRRMTTAEPVWKPRKLCEEEVRYSLSSMMRVVGHLRVVRHLHVVVWPRCKKS